MRAILEDDFTSVHIAADAASKKSQKLYVRIICIDLWAMIIASILAVYNYESASYKEILYIVTGILMLLSLVLTIIILTLKLEDTWYKGRALAESCKTVTWRFMTRTEPFQNNLDAENKFTKRIDELSNEFSELRQSMDSMLMSKSPLITDFMKEVRRLPLDKRKEFYIKNRVEEQKIWYSNKANYNRARYIRWFVIIIITQFLSALSIGYMIYSSDSNWNLVGIFTTISASAISWLQVKRHQELKQAYTTAAHELNTILTLSNAINDDNAFSKFVIDSENAVSREHTVWLAQRMK